VSHVHMSVTHSKTIFSPKQRETTPPFMHELGCVRICVRHMCVSHTARSLSHQSNNTQFHHHSYCASLILCTTHHSYCAPLITHIVHHSYSTYHSYCASLIFHSSLILCIHTGRHAEHHSNPSRASAHSRTQALPCTHTHTHTHTHTIQYPQDRLYHIIDIFILALLF